MSEKLQGKVIIVTGAASGICRETALLLAREGSSVVVADVDSVGGEETGHKGPGPGGRGAFHPHRCLPARPGPGPGRQDPGRLRQAGRSGQRGCSPGPGAIPGGGHRGGVGPGYGHQHQGGLSLLQIRHPCHAPRRRGHDRERSVLRSPEGRGFLPSLCRKQGRRSPADQRPPAASIALRA